MVIMVNIISINILLNQIKKSFINLINRTPFLQFLFCFIMIAKVTQTLIRNNKIQLPIKVLFSSKNSINYPPAKYADHRNELKQNGWRDVDPTHTKSQTTHLSNGQQLIHQIPVLKVHQDVVRCMGGVMPGAGHPQVYIQLNTKKPGQAVSCKYCGLRYALEGHHH